MNYLGLEASHIRELILKKEITSTQVVEGFLDQIERHKDLNAIVNVNEKSLDRAKSIDSLTPEQAMEKKLLGVPIIVKDLICTEGLETTAASKMLDGFIPPYSATLISRLEKNGAIVLAKANLDEFAMGSSNETSFYGSTLNPWNKEYVPGGSSGGSAAALAAAMAPVSIGTDTGGSIRQPAHFCGVVGLKPTYGRISRYGVIAFASSFDQAGPMTTSVKDAALVCEVMSGYDPHDGTSSEREVPSWSESICSDVSKLTIGIPKEYMEFEVDEDTRKVFNSVVDLLKKGGANIVEVSLSLVKQAIPVYYLITSSEASSNLSRFDGVRYGYRADFKSQPAEDLIDFYGRTRGLGFGHEVKRRIMLGTFALSSGYYDDYFQKACRVRRLIQNEFLSAFGQCDAILSPVATSAAFKLKEKVDDPLAMFANDIFTTSANLAGIPALSVPAGFSSLGLPIGIQLQANHFNEQVLFDIGSYVEKELNLKKRADHVL
ncbi:MAG: Asp-tRNA(Asn)/Glu-tRNA(Gln) amidotransferase subunit GatA [Bdellovibrionales bacterium]|nr:Asp-tRNA(Asn)/Glu-tRNA(Gln) amidotransferase subunit GatA [Bdellovibrionales bacterium]